MRVSSAFLASLFLCAAPACGAIWGFEDGQLGSELNEAGASSGNASSGGASDAAPDAPIPDAPDTPAPPNCGDRAPEGEPFYVDSFAAGDNAECSPDTPCKSINHAVSLVTAERHVIYLATGHYDESIVVPSDKLGLGLRIEARWQHGQDGWTPYCDEKTNGTEVVGTTAHALEVVAADPDDAGADDAGEPPTPDAGTGVDVELRFLSLYGPASSDDGFSSYGVFARGTRVALHYATVIADFGAPGRTPGDNERPVAATGGPNCPGSGEDGAQGASGSALGKGTYTRDGFVPDNVPETKAANGHRGSCSGGCISSANGGAPGVDAHSGGASIAAYLWDATLEMDEHSGLVAYGGGAGGNGGLGGDGATIDCELSGNQSIGGPGGTGSPGAGGPGACVVKNEGSTIPASLNGLCSPPEIIAPGGRGGPGVVGNPGDREPVIAVSAPVQD